MTDSSSALDLSRFGLLVGHATDEEGGTGLTVIRAPSAPLAAGVAVTGRATGTRELALLEPDHLVDRVDAVLLTGGSAYGLDAAAGVMRWMEERGRGFDVGGGVVPIVPVAVIFDLAPLGQFDRRPTAEMAYDATDRGSAAPLRGSVGAGRGATVGKALGPAAAMKGGFGVAEISSGTAAVAALAVVNAFGDVRDGTGRILAGARNPDGSFADGEMLLSRGAAVERFHTAAGVAGQNTTLAVVAADRPLPKPALAALARSAARALARRITPCGTTFDGDVVFAVAPYSRSVAGGTRLAVAEQLQLEVLASSALEAAIEDAVRSAVGSIAIPGLASQAP